MKHILSMTISIMAFFAIIKKFVPDIEHLMNQCITGTQEALLLLCSIVGAGVLLVACMGAGYFLTGLVKEVFFK